MSAPVLVRVSPEILEHLKAGDVEPVVILGVEEQDDGTHDMVLRSVDRDLVAERDRYRDALARIANAESGPWGQIAHAALHPERKAA